MSQTEVLCETHADQDNIGHMDFSCIYLTTSSSLSPSDFHIQIAPNAIRAGIVISTRFLAHRFQMVEVFYPIPWCIFCKFYPAVVGIQFSSERKKEIFNFQLIPCSLLYMKTPHIVPLLAPFTRFGCFHLYHIMHYFAPYFWVSLTFCYVENFSKEKLSFSVDPSYHKLQDK